MIVQAQGQLLLEDIKDRPLDGYGTTGQPNGRLLEWPYVGKNGLYYGRDAVALSDAEKSMQVQVCCITPSLYKSHIRSPRYYGKPAVSPEHILHD